MLISIDEINKSLKTKGWKYTDKKITKLFNFDNYMDGINFAIKVASIAENQNHHPKMVINWCEIEIIISSHELNGVTTKCVNLATTIDLI